VLPVAYGASMVVSEPLGVPLAFEPLDGPQQWIRAVDLRPSKREWQRPGAS
jgi:hypothetical protein